MGAEGSVPRYAGVCSVVASIISGMQQAVVRRLQSSLHQWQGWAQALQLSCWDR
jgi:hypothetical protein